MGMITFWFQKHNHADQERNAPGRAYPERSTLLVQHRAEEQALQRSCQKGGTATDEKTKKNHSNYSNTNEFMFCKQILGRDYKV